VEKLTKLGNVRKALTAVGVVLVSSSSPTFEADVEKLAEVQRVLPDITLNWQQATWDKNKVVEAAVGAHTGGPSPVLETSANIGLKGENPFVPLQWGLTAVNAKEAFFAGYRGAGARVAVLDGGFHLRHPDLVHNIISSVSFVPFESAQMSNPSRFSHGTHVAGIIAAADNNIGTVGIAPSAQLMLVKVLSDDGAGSWSSLLQGIMYAADNGAKIINMSLGTIIPRNGKFLVDNGTPGDTSDDYTINDASGVQDLITAMNRACQYARKKGALLIAAAGNNGMAVSGQGQGSFYPANCVDVVAVSASAPRNWGLSEATSLCEPSSFTNYGSSLVAFAAPGGDYMGSQTMVHFFGTNPAWVYDMVLSTSDMGFNGAGSYTWSAGTSMASPAVAGVAALIVGKYGGNISPAQLETKLKASAVDLGVPGKDDYFGFGHVNAGNAVKQ
jgi:subtilisin family serine protease